MPSFRCSVHSYTYFFGRSHRPIVFNIKCSLLLCHSIVSSQADTQLLDGGGDREFSDSTICFGAQVGGQEIPLNYPEVQGKVWIRTPKRSACLKTSWEAEEEIQFTGPEKNNSGRLVNVANNWKVNRVRNCLERAADQEPDKPGRTARRNPLGISKSSFKCITKQHLKLHPYKITRVQKLQPYQIAPNSTGCCELFKKTLKVNPSYLNHFEVDLEK